MSATNQAQPTPQPQDATPVIRALQAQRNAALDQLADADANLQVTNANLQALVQANGKLQSQLDDANQQLETTKAALADLQTRASSIDAANVELTKQLAAATPKTDAAPAAPAAAPSQEAQAAAPLAG